MNIKVVCLNMWLGGKLFENIQPFIERENADILVLQEVHHAESLPPQQEWHAVGELAHILGYPKYAFAPASSVETSEGFRIQFGNAILSRLPITSATSVFYDVPYNGMQTRVSGDYTREPRNLQHAKITAGDTTLHIFNTQGIWGFDGDDNERRLLMGDIIAEQVQDKQQALLMGDFNVLEGTKAIGKIEVHMKNIFKGELTTSFNMKHKNGGGFGTAVVDMMFASPDIKILNHYSTSDNVSDHVPLVVEFEIA